MNIRSGIFGKAVFAVAFISFLLLISSCEKYKFMPPSVDPNVTWHLSTDIQPIFSANCILCHGGIKSPDLREGKSYASLTTGGFVNAPAESSRLYSKMTSGDHVSRSSDAEKLKVLYWITQGAKNN